MLPTRDIYNRDFIFKYYPNTSHEVFQRDMFDVVKSQLHIVTFEDEDAKQIADMYSSSIYGVTFTLTSSVLMILLYNKIPGLRRFQNKWGKFFLKLGMLFVPVNLLSMFNFARSEQMSFNLYRKYQPRYVAYKITGDIRKLNPKTKVLD